MSKTTDRKGLFISSSSSSSLATYTMQHQHHHLLIVFFTIQMLVTILTTIGMLLYMSKVMTTSSSSSSLSKNDNVAAAAAIDLSVAAIGDEMQSKNDKLSHLLRLLEAGSGGSDDNMYNQLKTVLSIVDDDDDDDDDGGGGSGGKNTTVLNFTRLEMKNFAYILGKSKYSYKPNILAAANNGRFRYKHIFTFPFNFTLIMHTEQQLGNHRELFAYVASSFQTYYMMHSQLLSPEKARAIFQNVERHGYRYPDSRYPGGQNTGGVYNVFEKYFITRDSQSYSVEAHEFGHALQYLQFPNFWRGRNDLYIDAMANLLGRMCSHGLSNYPTLASALKMSPSDRYNTGPALLAFLFSNPELRSTFINACEKNDNNMEKEIIKRFSSVYDSSRDYCRDFINAATQVNDFWKEIANEKKPSFVNIINIDI